MSIHSKSFSQGKIAWYVLASVLIIGIFISIWFSVFTLERWLSFANQFCNNAKMQEAVLGIFTEKTCWWLKVASICFVSACIIGFYFTIKNKVQLQVALQKGILIVFADAKRLFVLPQFSKQQKNTVWLLVVFLIAHSVYYFVQWPITHDEAWSYQYFVNGNFFTSFLAPYNNHYLFTLVSWFMHIFLPNVLALRIIALLAGVVSVFAFAHSQQKMFIGFWFTISMVLFATALPLLYYSIIGRSYSCTILFAAIGLYCFMEIFRQKATTKHFVYLGISQALGVWSCIFYFLPASIFLLSLVFCLYKKNGYKLVSTVIIFVVITIIALGIPLIILKGVTPLQSAAMAYSQQNLLDVFLTTCNRLFFYSTSWRFAMPVSTIVVMGILFFSFWNSKKWSLLFLLQLCVPIFYAFISSVWYERLFTYCIVFYTPVLVFTLQQLCKVFKFSLKIKNEIVLLFLLPISILLFRNCVLFYWSVQKDKDLKVLASYIQNNKNINTIYTTDVYAVPALQYYWQKQNNREIVITKSFTDSNSKQTLQNTIPPYVVTLLEDSNLVKNYQPLFLQKTIAIWQH